MRQNIFNDKKNQKQPKKPRWSYFGCHAVWMDRDALSTDVKTIGIDVSQHAEFNFDGYNT